MAPATVSGAPTDSADVRRGGYRSCCTCDICGIFGIQALPGVGCAFRALTIDDFDRQLVRRQRLTMHWEVVLHQILYSSDGY